MQQIDLISFKLLHPEIRGIFEFYKFSKGVSIKSWITRWFSSNIYQENISTSYLFMVSENIAMDSDSRIAIDKQVFQEDNKIIW